MKQKQKKNKINDKRKYITNIWQTYKVKQINKNKSNEKINKINKTHKINKHKIKQIK